MCPTNRATWLNLRILSTLLLVFLCGAMAGALAMSLGFHKWIHRSAPHWDEAGNQISVPRLTKELDLTPDQTRQLEAELDDFVKYYHAVQAEMDEVRATGKNGILRILNEEQKRKFEKLTADLDAKR
jgi:hypothetical protein